MTRKLYSLLALLTFVFLIARVLLVPLVHDEIATFFYYIQQIEYNPLAGANPDANNHILNSLTGGISHKLFGYSFFSIRLPNLLSFLFYAYFVYKIGEKLTQSFSKWMFYVAMILPIYFIQFFALSRGYGMSMAFLMGGLLYTLNLYEKKSTLSFSLGMLCLLVAVYANMSLLPLALIMMLVIAVLVYLRKKEYSSLTSLSVIGGIGALFLVGIYYAVVISFKMKNEGALYYGELDGFWDITVKSQLLMLFENQSLIPQLILIGVLVLTLILYITKIAKDQFRSILLPDYLFFFLLVGVIVGIDVMAIVLEVNYPEDRVGMYLYPLLVGALCFGVDTSDLKLKNYFLIPLFIIPIYSLVSVNFYKTSQWKSGYIPERFYEAIKSHETGSKYPATVGGDGQRIFIYTNKIYMDEDHSANKMQLWQKTLFDTNLNLKLPNHPGKYHDYLVTNSKYIKDILPLYDSIDGAALTGFGFFKRKEPVEKEFLYKTDTNSGGEITHEFFEFYHEEFDSLDYDAVMLGFDLKMQSLRHPFKSRLVVELRDKETGNQLDYQFFQLNWMYPKVESSAPIIKNMYFNNLKHYTKNGPIEIVVYLWNIDKKPYSIYRGEVEVFKVKE